MVSSNWLTMSIITSLLHVYHAHCEEKLQSCSAGYDLTDFISQINLQFCTFVEIGQGYCSMFVEFRKDPSCPIVKPNSVAEVYLGTCMCSTMKEWDLCSEPLRKSRPYECYLDDLDPIRRNGSARVHRRLCDPTKMYQMVQPCDCAVPFAQRTLYPVKGFLTCYRAPLPRSICSTHSVCGVYNCVAKNYYGLSMVHCDPLCLGKQPFCEESGPITSRPPIVTSFWTEWTCPHKDDMVEVSESICIDKETNSPAFDCLGPGSYCCPNKNDCHCEVSTTMSEMKVTRYIFRDDIDFKKRHAVRFVGSKRHYGKREQKNLWEHMKQVFGDKIVSETSLSILGDINEGISTPEYNSDNNHIKSNPTTDDKVTRRNDLEVIPNYSLPASASYAIFRKTLKGQDPSYMVIDYKPVKSDTAATVWPEEEDISPWHKSRYIMGNDSKYDYSQEFER